METKDINLTVIAHFYNEEFLLPHWLKLHTKIFDHGVMVDYDSTDNSIPIIKNIAPHWEIRKSRNKVWDFTDADQEVMDIEKEFDGWKVVLNITEFILHYDLKEYIGTFMRSYPNFIGVRTRGIIMVDILEERYNKVSNENLIFQKYHGYLESDVAPITPVNPLLRSRLIHSASCGEYTLGRHRTRHKAIIDDPKLFLLWFGFSPFECLKKRKLSFKTRMSERDKKMKAGFQHMWDESQLEREFIKESERSYNLLEKVPQYREMVETIKKIPAYKVSSNRQI